MKKFVIRGEEVEVVFVRATEVQTNRPFRHIDVRFRKQAGQSVSILLQIVEDEYDEEAVIKMIQSIK